MLTSAVQMLFVTRALKILRGGGGPIHLLHRKRGTAEANAEAREQKRSLEMFPFRPDGLGGRPTTWKQVAGNRLNSSEDNHPISRFVHGQSSEAQAKGQS